MVLLNLSHCEWKQVNPYTRLEGNSVQECSDGGRMWAQLRGTRDSAALSVKGHLIPHMESLSVEAAWQSNTVKRDCGLVHVLFSSLLSLENPTNLCHAMSLLNTAGADQRHPELC